MSVNNKKSGGKSISKSFCILRIIAEHPGSSLGEIAKHTGFARSTVQGIVEGLQFENVVMKKEGLPGVFLGIELVRIAAKVEMDVRALFLPFMKRLSSQAGDNVNLTIFRDGKVTVIEQISSNEDIRAMSFIGKSQPLHCSATGKAHLSSFEPDQILEILGQDLRQYTPKTETNPHELLMQIQKFRKVGVFFDDEELSEGICAVATLLPSFGNSSIAVSVSMTRQGFSKYKQEVAANLLAVKSAVEQQFRAS